MEQLPTSARYRRADGSHDTNVVAPLLVEEDPAFGLNIANKEGAHSNGDRMAKTHRDGAYYMGVDMAVYYYKEEAGTDSRNWEGIAPSGNWQQIGVYPALWGSWDGR
jgi:hypothetical protein